MSFLQIEAVYRVDPDQGCLQARVDTHHITPIGGSDHFNFDELFLCHGFHALDVAFTGHVLEENGVSNFDGLVLAKGHDGAIVAPAEYVEHNPGTITPEFAQKIITLSPEGIAQMGIQAAILDRIHSRFPRIRPLGH